MVGRGCGFWREKVGGDTVLGLGLLVPAFGMRETGRGLRLGAKAVTVACGLAGNGLPLILEWGARAL